MQLFKRKRGKPGAAGAGSENTDANNPQDMQKPPQALRAAKETSRSAQEQQQCGGRVAADRKAPKLRELRVHRPKTKAASKKQESLERPPLPVTAPPPSRSRRHKTAPAQVQGIGGSGASDGNAKSTRSGTKRKSDEFDIEPQTEQAAIAPETATTTTTLPGLLPVPDLASLPKKRRTQRQPLKSGSHVESLLADFDAQVEARISMMREHAAVQGERLRMAVETDLIKMRHRIKTMTMREFMSGAVASSAAPVRTASRLPSNMSTQNGFSPSSGKQPTRNAPPSSRKPFSHNRFTPLATKMNHAIGGDELAKLDREVNTLTAATGAHLSTTARTDALQQMQALQAQLDALRAQMQ